LVLGGEGSGHFGHAGRPGEVGGSASSGTLPLIRKRLSSDLGPTWGSLIKHQEPGPLTKKGKPTIKTTWTTEEGKELPKHLNVPIPPAWENVRYNKDKTSECVVTGRDAKGRKQMLYSEGHWQRVGQEKFNRVKKLALKSKALRERLGKESKTSDDATVLRLIHDTGIRPGSEVDTGGEKKAYGATTLRGYHVQQTDKGEVWLRFVGKEGVKWNLPIRDKDIAKDLLIRARKADRGPLFNASATSIRGYLKKIVGDEFKVKDIRTLKGTTLAIERVTALPKPTTMKQYTKQVKDVAKYVSKHLGNTPAVALKSYINPYVFSNWRI